MTFADELRGARRSRAPVLHEFLLSFKPNERTIHVFFEGPEDESVYINHLEAQKPSGYRLLKYRCQNKKHVYYIHGQLKEQGYTRERTLFFVDKDLSDFLQENHSVDSNIFVTHCYSVENYLVTAGMVERVLREIFHEFDQQRIEHSISLFEEQYSLFVRHIRFVMAWILLGQQLELLPNVSNIELGKIFIFDAQLQFRRRGNLSTIVQYLETSTKATIPRENFARLRTVWKLLLGCVDSKQFIRGKFDVWFLSEYLETLKEILAASRQKGDQKPGRLPPRPELVNFLGPRVSHIPHLTEFLCRNWQALSSKDFTG